MAFFLQCKSLFIWIYVCKKNKEKMFYCINKDLHSYSIGFLRLGQKAYWPFWFCMYLKQLINIQHLKAVSITTIVIIRKSSDDFQWNKDNIFFFIWNTHIHKVKNKGKNSNSLCTHIHKHTKERSVEWQVYETLFVSVPFVVEDFSALFVLVGDCCWALEM